MSDPKISIIVPVYNTEEYLSKCLTSLTYQTYSNLEIIVVNDGSTDNSLSIINTFLKKDVRIKCVNLTENQGLFNARLRGYEACTGEYIATLDSDDFVGRDYYRTLLEASIETDADIVCSNFVDYNSDTELKAIWIANHCLENTSLEGEEIVNEFFQTNFVSSTWWLMWNKLYKKSLWEQCYKYLVSVRKGTTYLEDFLYGNIFLNNAKKFVYIPISSYFYVRRSDACTASNNDVDTIMRYADNKAYVIDYVSKFYEKIGRDEKVRTSLNYFIEYQKQSDYQKIISKITDISIRAQYKKKLDALYPITNNGLKIVNYFERTGNWDDRADKLKDLICSSKIKVVSFDIFDTILLRPFYRPTDLFEFLDEKYESILNHTTFTTFSTMREEAEKLLRIDIKNNGYSVEEITLDQIYQKISDYYGIEEHICKILKAYEIELEIRFSQSRNFIKTLYKLAKRFGKKIVCTSDTYFESDIILKLLSKQGLSFDKVYLSSEYGVTKRSGKLFDVVLNDLKEQPHSILHIGDNWNADIMPAKDKGIVTYFVPKAIECFENAIPPHKRSDLIKNIQKEPVGNWIRYKHVLGSFGVRTACAVIANKFFDNPFETFAEKSDFNQNPYYLGYFALGMNNYGIAKWLLQSTLNKNVENIHFVARDGFSVKQTYDILSANYKGAPKSNYIYMSRKATLPLLIKTLVDLETIDAHINVLNFSPREIISLFNSITSPISEKDKKLYLKNGILLDEKIKSRAQYIHFIRCAMNISFSQEKIDKYRAIMKKHFSNIIKPGDVMFDIGYSGRGQALLSDLLGYPVDAYYIHTLKDVPFKFSNKYNFRIHSYYTFTPTITGRQREMLQSDTSPSCIGYEIANNGVRTIFEPQSLPPWGKYILDTIHRGSKDFMKDIISIFGEWESNINFSNFDISFAHEYLMCNISEKDLKLFKPILFEDDILEGINDRSLSDIWKKDQLFFSLTPHNIKPKEVPKNIKEPKEVKNIEKPLKTVSNIDSKEESGDLKNMPDVLKKSDAIKRAVFYLLFDRKKFTKEVRKYLSRNETTYDEYAPFITDGGYVEKAIIENKNNTVFYYALSNYQLLCCIIHKMTYHPESDAILLLSSYRSDKYDAIIKSNLFSKGVFLWDDKEPISLFTHANKFVDNFSNKEWKLLENALFTYVSSKLPFEITGFKEYNLSADCEPIGLYFIKNKFKYNFFEDSAGIFSRPEIIKTNNKTLFTKSKRMLIERYPTYGENKRIENIFLNKSAQTDEFILPKKSVDFNVLDMMQKLSKEQIECIFSIFRVAPLNIDANSKKILLLTQQLAAFKKMTTVEQDLLYSLLMDLFGRGHQIIVKPHPDDTYSDYKALFTDCSLIDTSTLSEFLPFMSKSRYDRAITVTSASILNLKEYIDVSIRFNSIFESEWKMLPITYTLCKICSFLKLSDYSYYICGIDAIQFENISSYSDATSFKIVPKNIPETIKNKSVIFSYKGYNNKIELEKILNPSSFVFSIDGPLIENVHTHNIKIKCKSCKKYEHVLPKEYNIYACVPKDVPIDPRSFKFTLEYSKIDFDIEIVKL